MARARNIKPSIMDNEELAELEPVARLLFIYLWMLADREGRLEDRPKRIAAQALPYDRQVDVGAMLDELHKAGFILRYEAAGVACIQITAFAKHQSPHIREAESVLPSCTSQGEDEHQPRKVQERERDDTHLAESLRRRIIDRDGGKCLCCSSDADLHVDHIIPRARGGKTDESNLQTLCRKCNQSKGARNQTDYRSTNLGTASTLPRSPDSGFSDSGFSDCGKGAESPAEQASPAPAPQKPAKARAQKTALPADFGVSARVAEWANERGFVSLDQHLEVFKRKAIAKGYTYASWDDAFMEAIRQDWAGIRAKAPQTFAQQAADVARVTVPARPGRDPVLEQIEADRAKATPIPEAIRVQMEKLKQGATHA